MIVAADCRKRFVTYLKKDQGEFDPGLLHTIINAVWDDNKPVLAWWGSPANSDYGWKDWCEIEQMFLDDFDWEKPIFWHLKDGSKVLQIDFPDVYPMEESILNNYLVDQEKLPEFMSWHKEFVERMDFQKMLDDGIQAVELMHPSVGRGLDSFKNKLARMFYSWDCESIVILDNTVIEFEEKQ